MKTIGVILTTGMLMAAVTLTTACKKKEFDEQSVNSNDEDTGVIATVDGCSVYRVINHGNGPTYVFFTRCKESVTTDFADMTGKSTTEYNVSTEEAK